MNGSAKQEITAEQALGVLDALLAEVKQPPLSRNDQIAIQSHVKTIFARFEQDAAKIESLEVELIEKHKYVLQLEKRISLTDPPPDLTNDTQLTNGAL